ncbi:MAG TPA: flagella basal body P-ring formation protein FlgA [Candidatus Dormibacteraeota bacterium]|nr:flagella basal body P-ring formation protein FlgA [Candidatus Dormibacteraeota bacterium]
MGTILKAGKRLLAKTGLIVGVLLLASSAAAQTGVRIALARQTIVNANVVPLSDLLPGTAPPNMRSRAQQIILIDAPMPGEHRQLTREDIASALRDIPVLRNELEIPPGMEIRRWARRVTREEVLAAVDRTLHANGWSSADTLVPGDVILSADVSVSENNPKLQVTQIQRAADHSGSRVLVWVTSEPRVPRFWVGVYRPIDPDAKESARELAAVPVALQRNASAIVPVSERMPITQRESRSLGPVLVKAGAPVQLVVRVGGMTIQGTGIPLDRGRKGDEVRVRAVESGKILVGTVVGAQIVQVSF